MWRSTSAVIAASPFITPLAGIDLIESGDGNGTLDDGTGVDFVSADSDSGTCPGAVRMAL